MLYIKENKEMIHQPSLMDITIYLLSYHEIGEQLSLGSIPKGEWPGSEKEKGFLRDEKYGKEIE